MDPCLWVKQSNSGIFMMEIYVDNCLTIRSSEDIKEVIQDLNIHDFVMEEDLKDCSCHIKIDKEYGIASLPQPHPINNLKEKFGEERFCAQIMRKKFRVQANLDRFDVGMLLFFILNSRPDMVNVVSETSK
jgi:hypothetical protein